jgi:hypothetical protein
MSDYFHHVPGRMRIKIPTIKQRPYKVTAVELLFKCESGIIDAKASPVTGSLVLTYDPDVVDVTALIAVLKNNAYLREDTLLLVNRFGKATVFSHLTQAVGRAALSWAVGKALESNGLGVLTALI